MKNRFENKAFIPITLLFVAFLFNDWWSVQFGFPTPIQVVILGTILFYWRNFFASVRVPIVRRVRQFIYLYVVYVWISTAIVYFEYGYFDQTSLTITFNLLFVQVLMPYLVKGFSEYEMKTITKIIFFGIIFITIPSGIYEYVTDQNILKTVYGLSPNVFYLRGLHIDKLEFGSVLAVGGFLALGQVPARKTWSLLFAFVFMLCSLLILLTYSTTTIVGYVLGLLIMLPYFKKTIHRIPILVGMIALVVVFVSNSRLFEQQLESYNVKYKLNVVYAAESNFRLRALEAGVEKFNESPIFGNGIGRSGIVIYDYFRSIPDMWFYPRFDIFENVNSHNIFINEILDFGIIGFLPLFLLLYFTYRLLFRKIPPVNTDSYNYSFFLAVKAISVLTFCRFILYYHRFDQAFYVFFISFAIIIFGYMRNKSLELKMSANESADPGQKT